MDDKVTLAVSKTSWERFVAFVQSGKLLNVQVPPEMEPLFTELFSLAPRTKE